MSITPPPPYRPTAARMSQVNPGYAPQIQRIPAAGNPKAKSALVLAIVAPLLCGPLEFLALAWGIQALKVADQTSGEGRGKAIAAIAISATYTVVFVLVMLAVMASSGSSGQ